jgi:hypothetical protein
MVRSRPPAYLVQLAKQHPIPPNNDTAYCKYCLRPLDSSNNDVVCDTECGDGWWDIVPTHDGSLWGETCPKRSKSSTPNSRRSSHSLAQFVVFWRRLEGKLDAIDRKLGDDHVETRREADTDRDQIADECLEEIGPEE